MASVAGTVLAPPAVDLPSASPRSPSAQSSASAAGNTGSSNEVNQSSSSMPTAEGPSQCSSTVSASSSSPSTSTATAAAVTATSLSSASSSSSSAGTAGGSTSIGSVSEKSGVCEDVESALISSLAGLTIGKLKLRQKQEAKKFRQEWDSRVKKAKGSAKRQIKREMKIRQSEMIDRHKKEESLLKSGGQRTSSSVAVSSEPAGISASSSSSRRRKKKQETALEREAMLRAVEQSEEVLAADGRRGREEEEEESEDRRSQENRRFRRMLQPLGLRVNEVAADGHCLFESLSQQLRLVDGDSEWKCADLRRCAAEFMRGHKEMFLPFLLNDSGSPMSDSDFDEYCSGIAGTDSMSGDGKSIPRVLWGGHHEIVALSRALDVSIVVYSVSSDPLLIAADRSETISTADSIRNRGWLRISFHQHMYSMGQHYNSVVPL